MIGKNKTDYTSEKQIELLENYFNPFLSIFSLVIEIFVLEILIITYVFTSSIINLLGKNITIVVRILTFTLAVFSLIGVVFLIPSTTALSLLVIDKGINAGIYAQLANDFTVCFFPIHIQAAEMWILFNGNLDSTEEIPQIESITTESLII